MKYTRSRTGFLYYKKGRQIKREIVNYKPFEITWRPFNKRIVDRKGRRKRHRSDNVQFTKSYDLRVTFEVARKSRYSHEHS